MKQRISTHELAQLTKSQRANLQQMWIPEKYDIAIAYVCVNAETEEYNEVEFCIGSVKIKPSGTVTISDLRATDGYLKPFEEEDGENADGALHEYEEPIKFLKGQCLPLLSIGQLISLLQYVGINKYHFYLLAGDGEIGCEIGKFNSVLKTGMLADGFENVELVDLLWKLLKETL